jgi:2-haloacid dehalogenase
MIDGRAVTFDTYGTPVDWRSRGLDELRASGAARGLRMDWTLFLDEWKACPAPDLAATGKWNIVVDSVDELAAALGT